MKKNVTLAALLAGTFLVSLSFGSCTPKTEEAASTTENTEEVAQPEVKKARSTRPIGDLTDSLSYAYGVGIGDNLAQNFEAFPVEINIDLFLKAFEATLKGNTEKLKIQPEQAYQIFQHCIMSVQNNIAQENKKAGEKFLAENAKKEGVKTTESGLQYKVITEGSGNKPAETDKVSVHYQGTLLDGTVFDSSIERGTPAQFPVNGVIKGWTEGLQLMSVGSKYELYIPAELAYGDQGAGDVIQPGSTLIFEVELLEILK